MTSPSTPASSPRHAPRRPLPAVICLVALIVLAAIVWWRVLGRSRRLGGQEAAPPAAVRRAPPVLPQPKQVALTVYNSTGRTGLAKTTAAAFTKLGFTSRTFGNDPSSLPVAGVAEIRFVPADKDAAGLLAYYLPGAKLVPLDAATDPALAVALGTEVHRAAGTDAVSSALKSAGASQVPPGSSTPPGGRAHRQLLRSVEPPTPARSRSSRAKNSVGQPVPRSRHESRPRAAPRRPRPGNRPHGRSARRPRSPRHSAPPRSRHRADRRPTAHRSRLAAPSRRMSPTDPSSAVTISAWRTRRPRS